MFTLSQHTWIDNPFFWFADTIRLILRGTKNFLDDKYFDSIRKLQFYDLLIKPGTKRLEEARL